MTLRLTLDSTGPRHFPPRGGQVIDEKEQAALFRMLRGSDVDKRVMLRMQGTVLDSTAEMNNRLVGLEDQITAIHEALADIATKVGA